MRLMEAKNKKVALVLNNEVLALGVLVKQNSAYSTVKVEISEVFTNVMSWRNGETLDLSVMNCNIVP